MSSNGAFASMSGFEETVAPHEVGYRRTLVAWAAGFVAVVVAGLVVHGLLTQSVRSVRIGGEFSQVSRAELESVIGPVVARGLLSVDVETIRSAALSLPWVKDVSVRRVWPDSMHVSVTERIAVARWRDGGYLESDGHLFVPAGSDGLESLPELSGPAGSHARALGFLAGLERDLAPLGRRILSVDLSPRDVLRVSLDGPLELVLRPEFLGARLATFVSTIWHYLGGRLGEIARIDLRYPNGFAVRPHRTSGS